MPIKKESFPSAKLLNLTNNEAEVFRLIQIHQQATPVSLAKISKIPRPTIYITLEKLEKRNLVTTRKIGKRKVWEITSTSTLKNSLDDIKNTLGTGDYNKVQITDETDIVIHRGKDAILELFKEFAENHNGKRLMGMSGDKSAATWVDTITTDEVNLINNRIRKGGLLTEMITSRTWFEQQVNMFGKSWIENFVGRAAQIHFVNQEYLDYESQIFIFGSQIYLVSMKEALFIEVKNKQISKLLISLLGFVKDHSRSVDITKMLMEMMGREC